MTLTRNRRWAEEWVEGQFELYPYWRNDKDGIRKFLDTVQREIDGYQKDMAQAKKSLLFCRQKRLLLIGLIAQLEEEEEEE